MSDADVAQPFAAPDGLTSENGLCVWNSTAQNVFSVPDCVALDGGGWQSDAVPFAEAADGVLTPAAKTPGLRATGDVAMTNATYVASVITTAVRVFRVVPAGQVPEGSDKSGSSWANATDDIDAALKDAAR